MAISEYRDAEYLDEDGLHERYLIPPRTAQHWRASGDGPRFVRLGPRRVVDRITDTRLGSPSAHTSASPTRLPGGGRRVTSARVPRRHPHNKRRRHECGSLAVAPHPRRPADEVPAQNGPGALAGATEAGGIGISPTASRLPHPPARCNQRLPPSRTVGRGARRGDRGPHRRAANHEPAMSDLIRRMEFYACKNRSKPAPDFGRNRQVISAESGT